MQFENIHALLSISPVDGRYKKSTEELATYFSEFGLIKYRVKIEIEYLIELINLPLESLSNFPKEKILTLRNIVTQFNIDDALQIKELEKTTNHDVKAVEYFIKGKLKSENLGDYLEFIHFGLTSQDINNTAIPLSLKDAFEDIIWSNFDKTITKLSNLAQTWKEIPLLAYTHGQPASPTRLGKELMVFVERIEKQLTDAKKIPFAAKFGGATGNFNAHFIAYPEINWISFSNHFVNDTLGLTRSQLTTQIEHYDYLAALFDNNKRINSILIDLCRDIWQYISLGYFKQKIKVGEIGSSAMPHKVNPIDFENAEGNFGFANAIFEFLSAKLPVSRLQRDLTDSTVLRNIGVPLAHTSIAVKSLLRGLDKLELNESKINEDLNKNWAVVAEGIQTILRTINYPEPYEALKELTRTGEKIDQKLIQQFIENLKIDDLTKEKLKAITPFNYVGIQMI